MQAGAVVSLTNLGGHAFQFGTGCVGAKTSDEIETNVTLYAHAARVDPENVCPAIIVGKTELDTSVKATWTKESWIQRVWPERAQIRSGRWHCQQSDRQKPSKAMLTCLLPSTP